MAREAAALTQRRLRAAVVTIVGRRGLASVTARSVAAEAGVNQALIFYHFGTLGDLVAAAYRESVDEALERYREALASSHGLGEVLDAVKAELGTDRADGGAALMAQLLAAAGQDEALAKLARELLGEWRTVVGKAVERAMVNSPVEGSSHPRASSRRPCRQCSAQCSSTAPNPAHCLARSPRCASSTEHSRASLGCPRPSVVPSGPSSRRSSHRALRTTLSVG